MGGDFARGYMAGLRRAIQELNHSNVRHDTVGVCPCHDAEHRIRHQLVKSEQTFQKSQEESSEPSAAE